MAYPAFSQDNNTMHGNAQPTGLDPVYAAEQPNVVYVMSPATANQYP